MPISEVYRFREHKFDGTLCKGNPCQHKIVETQALKDIKSYIKQNFVAKSEIDRVLRQGHGGGNWRRLLNLLKGE
jgi:hypothetical protein